jgi:hypothetical protein
VAPTGTMMSEAEFREKMAKIAGSTDEVNRLVATLISRSNRAMRFLPPDVSHTLDGALARLRELVKKFCAELAKMALNPGWPFGLISAGNDWTNKVGGPATELSAALAPNELSVDIHWGGMAARKYAKVPPSQQQALEAIKAAADVIDTSLMKIAWAIFGLWTGILLAVAQYLSELKGEAATAAVNPPVAGAAAVVSTVKATGLMTLTAAAFVTYAGLILETMKSLNQNLHTSDAFLRGEWPKSTTSGFDDGSRADGDPRDWRRLSTND